MSNKVSTVLHDVHGSRNNIEANISISEVDGSLLLRAKGYSDCTSDDDEGVPLIIENVDGILTLRIFGDINQEDPTEIIQLSGAKNSNRYK